METRGNKRWINLVTGHTLQDVLAICLPYMVFLAVIVVTASFAYDPTMKLLLCAMIPEESWKTWPWFWACFPWELHFVAMSGVIAAPVWQLQVISFELINVNLQTIVMETLKR